MKLTRMIASVATIAATWGLAQGCAVEGPPGGEPQNEGGATVTPPEGGSGNEMRPPDTPDPEPSCDDLPAPIDPTALPLCPTDICAGGARCLPNVLVEKNGGPEQLAQLANCDADNKCVPDGIIEFSGLFTATTCRSIGNAEGRCLSTCIPEVSEQHAEIALPVDICPEHNVCVPCFDPRTGESTGACDQGCDEGPVEPPLLLPTCCNDLGTCVPQTEVPADRLSDLGDYGCGEAIGSDFICAPNVFIQDQNFQPPTCDDMPFLLTLLLDPPYLTGACLPDCLPAIDDATVSLKEGSCGSGMKCVPCYEPGLLGPPKSTGACDL